jgi:hypothetical protein
MSRFARFIVAFTLSVPMLAGAQNLLLNPGFDNDVAGWSASGPGSIAWSMLDANTNPASGSVQLTNSSATPSNGATVGQCLPMPARWAFRVSGKILVPSGPNQALSNTTRVDVRFASNSGCTQFLGGSTQIGSTPSQLDAWHTAGPVVRVAPVGTVALQVRGLLTKIPAGGSIIAHFDDFSVEVDTFFVGDFE